MFGVSGKNEEMLRELLGKTVEWEIEMGEWKESDPGRMVGKERTSARMLALEKKKTTQSIFVYQWKILEGKR
jgi:hypothetical protein